ncbi:unnamed protein product [Ceratitis capitata]|uniref:(Mediterranean fruit fly) hypothetical protein n=1 Tax=Ceratitis capitata TaxID=7213 RepID=A0A811UX71_CERCA|nr:unnamed protein product [Ceratitis capitata]
MQRKREGEREKETTSCDKILNANYKILSIYKILMYAHTSICSQVFINNCYPAQTHEVSVSRSYCCFSAAVCWHFPSCGRLLSLSLSLSLRLLFCHLLKFE